MSARTLQAKLAAEVRYRPNEDHTELKLAHRTERLAERIRREVDDWPPLTPAQRERLARILRGGDDG